MKKNWIAFSITTAILCTPPIVQARDVLAVGNSAAGKEKAESCAGCHGENGNSMLPTFPKLAEQHATYIGSQLHAFKDGSRPDPVMAPMAMGLSTDDIADISAYFSSQTVTENPKPTLPPDDDADEAADEQKADETMKLLLLTGSNLYRNGNTASEVSACIACHGPSGEGNRPAAFPSLRSQHPDYLIKALTDFKKGLRNKNSDNMMNMIAKKMSDEEIKAVGYYISTLK